MPDSIINEQATKTIDLHPSADLWPLEEIETETVSHQPSDEPFDGTTDDFIESVGLSTSGRNRK